MTEPSPLDEIEREEAEAALNSRMTSRQQRFCMAYLRHGIAARAVRDAGYEITPEQQGSFGHRMLASPKIKEFLDERRIERLQRLAVTPQRIEEELAKIAFGSLAAITKFTSDGEPYIDMSEATADDFAAISEFTVEDFVDGRGEDARAVRRVKLKTNPKTEALRLLAQIRKMVGADVSVGVNVDLASEIREARKRAGRGEVDAPEGDDDQG